MIFERYSKYVKKFQGMSPHQILPSLNIKWAMTTARTDTMEEDVVRYIKDAINFLTIHLGFPEDIEQNLDKIICFYINNSQISEDTICCFVYTDETLDDLINKMERIVNIKAFI